MKLDNQDISEQGKIKRTKRKSGKATHSLFPKMNYMKDFRSTCLVVMTLANIMAFTQSSNNSCGTAIELDLFSGCGSSVNGAFILDSTNLVSPSSPFPLSPLECSGYTNAITPFSNDLWYRFFPTCTYAIDFLGGIGLPDDSIQISLWFGNNCAFLEPISCHTIPSGTSYTISGSGYTGGAFYVQVMSTSPITDSEFSLCINNTSPSCVMIPLSITDPTPVSCFQYVLNLNHPDIGLDNGVITIILEDSVELMNVQWSDDPTSELVRTGLSAGQYSVQITDNSGCIQIIETVLETMPLNLYQQDLDIDWLQYDSSTHVADILLPGQFGKYQLMVFNIQGNLLFKSDVLHGYSSHSLETMPKGLYLLVLLSETLTTKQKVLRN